MNAKNLPWLLFVLKMLSVAIYLVTLFANANLVTLEMPPNPAVTLMSASILTLVAEVQFVQMYLDHLRALAHLVSLVTRTLNVGTWTSVKMTLVAQGPFAPTCPVLTNVPARKVLKVTHHPPPDVLTSTSVQSHQLETKNPSVELLLTVLIHPEGTSVNVLLDSPVIRELPVSVSKFSHPLFPLPLYSLNSQLFTFSLFHFFALFTSGKNEE